MTLFYYPPYDLYRKPISAVLLDNMVAFYAMDSAAGANVPDSHGNADTLIDKNTVGRVAGKSGNASEHDIAAGDKYLSIAAADGNMFEFTGSFSIAAWIYVETWPTAGGPACYQTIMYRYTTAAGGFSMRLAAVGSSVPFGIGGGAAQVQIIHANCGIGKWVFLCGVNHAPTKTIQIWGSNSGSLVKDEEKTYAFAQAMPALQETKIGRNSYDVCTDGHIYIDSLTVFEKALSQSEIEWIYNSGTGRAYADYG